MTSPDTEFISILGNADAKPRGGAPTLPAALPILGLSDIVIFPAMVAPLLVDSGPSVKLIDDVVGGDRLIGVVLQRELPLPQVGDWLVLHDTGAYGASMSSNYNTRPLIPEVLVDGAAVQLIRRKQTVAELLALEDVA